MPSCIVDVTLPVDLVDQEVTADMLDKPLRTQPPTNDKESESNIVGNMFKKLRTAKSPLIVADGLSYPFQLQQRINELVTLTGIPAMSFTSGKGIVDETSPSWNPALPNTEAYSRNADLVLFFGPLLADTNTARWSAIPETKNTVYLNLDSVEMDDQVFTCRTASVLDALIHKLRQALPKDHLKRLNSTASPDSDPTPLVQNDSSIKQDDFWPAMSSFLRPHDTILLANGTPLIGGRSLRLPFNNQVIASSIWCSIGHMLPASQGVAAAKRDHGLPGRTILFEGDGSFQVTCQSISDIIRNRLDVTVIIVNNKGYTYERYLHGMTADYNDVPSWAYSEAAKFFGARENDPTYPVFGQQVSTWGHLIDTLESEAFSDGKGLKIIDVIMNPEDVPEKSKPGLANASEALRSF